MILTLGTKYQKCGSLNRVENHRLLAWYCKANHKSNLPREITVASTSCSHTFKCLNYKGNYAADNNQCLFWCHYFDKK